MYTKNLTFCVPFLVECIISMTTPEDVEYMGTSILEYFWIVVTAPNSLDLPGLSKLSGKCQVMCCSRKKENVLYGMSQQIEAS